MNQELTKPYIEKVWKESGFTKQTKIQEKAIPLILERKDIICESPTGTGKTLAYLLPILQNLDETKNSIQTVILAPSRELVMQILEEIRKWTKGTSIVSSSFIGGANIKKQVEKLKDKPQIVVGTTGRIIELIKMKKMKMYEVKTIVVDEADQMVLPEHLGNVREIIKSTMKDRQVLFFSATVSPQTEKIAKEIMKQPEIIRVEEKIDQINVEHLYIVSEQRDKIETLRRFMHTKPFRVIVFIKNLERLAEVEAKLQYHGIELAVLAGEAKKLERQQAMKKFRDGKISLLLTTDVGARGLDIQDVSHVVHFDFPKTTEQYLHRSGRTGRMGKKGTVISFVNARELSFLRKMGHELKIKFNEKRLHGGKVVDVK